MSQEPKKWRRGDVHPVTGLVFWDRSCGRERWVSEDSFHNNANRLRKSREEKKRTSAFLATIALASINEREPMPTLPIVNNQAIVNNQVAKKTTAEPTKTAQIQVTTSSKLLTQDEAADYLRLANSRTLAAWRLRRKGPPFVKLGSCVRYRLSDLDAFVAANTVGF